MTQKYYTVYLAGPISGLDYKNGQGWRTEVIDNLADNIEGLSPLRGKDYLVQEGTLTGSYNVGPLSTQRGIYARDRFDCHRADVIMVNFLDLPVDEHGNQRISIGTVMEIAWAAQNNTPIVLMMEENNVHQHPMIMEACPFVVETVNEGVDLVHDLLNDSRKDPYRYQYQNNNSA